MTSNCSNWVCAPPCRRTAISASALGLAIALLCATATPAREALVQVRDASGAPVEFAAAEWTPAGGAHPAAPVHVAIKQSGQAFQPPVTLIPTGSTVEFPNEDSVAHHVYSFSPAKKFDLPIYTGAAPQGVQFDKPGVVTIGCNIHDWMTAHIVVTDTRWAALTDSNGLARLADVPAGTGELRIWHPRLRGPAVIREVEWEDPSAVEVVLNLKPPKIDRRAPPPPGARGGYR